MPAPRERGRGRPLDARLGGPGARPNAPQEPVAPLLRRLLLAARLVLDEIVLRAAGARGRPEGDTERIIGNWIKKEAGRRQKLVIASKITGGRNINRRTIEADLRGSLERLGTDYLDVYMLHWPARYTPQSWLGFGFRGS